MGRRGCAYVFVEGALEELDDVFALDAWRTEAFGPPDEDTVVDAVLPTHIISPPPDIYFITAGSRARIRKLLWSQHHQGKSYKQHAR